MARAKPLSDDEVNQMLDALKSPRDRCMFMLGCKTGFRISELLSLRVADVLQYGRMRDSVTVKRSNTKCKLESRTVVLHKEAKRYIQGYLDSIEILHEGQRLFPFTRQHAHRLLKRAVNEVQLTGQVSAGSMRKSFAKRVYENLGKDLVNTQRALGHKNVTSTVYYLHFDQNEVDNAILNG